NTHTSGDSAATAPRSLRNAHAISSLEVTAVRSPTTAWIVSAATGSTGVSGSSLTTSTTGQYVIPSPYGRHRPRTTSAPSSEPRNSATRRDLPTPAAPSTVNMWQDASETTRSQASASSP